MRQLFRRSVASSIRLSRRQQTSYLSADQAPDRFLQNECYAALVDRSSAREARLLQASNERFDRLVRAEPSSEFARLAAFESGYLALATVLKPHEVADEAQPSLELVARSTGRLPLLAEDTLLALQLVNIYQLGGWETLDLEAMTEWCHRVRAAVIQHLQSV